MQQYSLANNFALSTKERKPTRVYLKCIRGGHYRNVHKLKDCDRVKIRPGSTTGCPYLLKISYKKGIKGYLPLKATHEIEGYHSHPLDDKCLESTLKGRMSKVTIEDAKNIVKLIESKTKTRKIQRAITQDGDARHKLYVRNISNIKAAFVRLSAPVI